MVINDQKPPEELIGARNSFRELEKSHASAVEWVLGSHPISLLEGADWVCVSGGVPLELPLIEAAKTRGIPLSNDSQIFLEECPCKTIGITGSAGKTTTTSLVGKIADTAAHWGKDITPGYRKVWVGGNIGSPLLALLDDMEAHDLAIMELSSFQLELMTKSVNIACVLNVTPNHLDRHASMVVYLAAKRRILEYQGLDDMAVLGRDDPGAWGLLGSVRGKIASFGKDKPPEGMPGAFIQDDTLFIFDGSCASRVMNQAEIQLRGWHNIENVLAACAISQAAGLPPTAMREAILAFTGVPHRLEWVITWKGADWYNDSIATAPERVIAAIHSFESPADINRPIVLLAGGRDKNLPWGELAKLIHERVDHLILFGEAAVKIAGAIGEKKTNHRPFSMDTCEGLGQAVIMAAGCARL